MEEVAGQQPAQIQAMVKVSETKDYRVYAAGSVSIVVNESGVTLNEQDFATQFSTKCK